MNKVNDIGLARMHNNEHIKLQYDCKSKIDGFGVAALGVLPVYEPWVEALNSEAKTIEVKNGFVVSAAIQAADKRRDHDHYSMRLYVESEMYGRDPARIEAAGRIMRIIRQVGNLVSLPFQEETVAISSLVNQLKDNYSADITLIGLEQKVAWLDESNNEFDRLFNDRANEAAARASRNTRAARQITDPLFRQLMSPIESMSAINKHAKPWADCIAQLNQVIDAAKTAMARRESGTKK